MSDVPSFLGSERNRAYIYRVLVSLIPVLVVAGVVTGDEAQVWLTVAAAVLGIGASGLAAKNTST